MDFCFLKGGAANFLEAFLNDSWPTGGVDLKLKLYTNTVALVNTLTAASFTEVIAEAGYESKTLNCGSDPAYWTIGDDPAGARYARQDFIFTGPLTDALTIKGYVVTDADDVALWAYEYDTPFAPDVGLALYAYPGIRMSFKNDVGTVSYLFDAGVLQLLNCRLNGASIESSFKLTVYSGVNYTPAVDYQMDPMTAFLTRGSWTIDATPTASYGIQYFDDFPLSDPFEGQVNGYIVSDESLSVDLWRVTFETPCTPIADDYVNITPKITLTDGIPTAG